MTKVKIIYLLYGKNIDYINEAKFSILSLLRTNPSLTNIHVITDTPTYFDGWPIQANFLSEKKKKQYLGHTQYSHRIKAEVIKNNFDPDCYNLFIDSDTIFTKNILKKINESIDKKTVIIDEIEEKISTFRKRDFFEKIADLIINKYNTNNSTEMINSGVFGLPKTLIDKIDSYTSILDNLHNEIPDVHITEQIALSIAIKDIKKIESKKHINHYYAKKKYYRAMINTFFCLHGSCFSKKLIDLSSEVPTTPPNPTFINLIKYKFLSRINPKNKKKYKEYYLLRSKFRNIYQKSWQSEIISR